MKTIEELQTLALRVLNTDKFIDMPHYAQILFVYLVLSADSLGFIYREKSISRMLMFDRVEREMASTTLIVNGFIEWDEENEAHRIVCWG